MDIIQQCEVKGVTSEAGVVTGVETTKGFIGCKKLGVVVAGHSGQVAEMAGFRLPIEAVALQAMVSEPIKPCMDVVVMANTVHGYMSQSDKGEMVIGGGTDGFNNFTQRGSFHHIEETLRALIETFPMISPAENAAAMGRDCRYDRRPLADHLENAVGELLHQLRLGDGRLQGHSGLGLGDGRADGQGRAGGFGRGVQHVALQGRPVH